MNYDFSVPMYEFGDVRWCPWNNHCNSWKKG